MMPTTSPPISPQTSRTIRTQRIWQPENQESQSDSSDTQQDITATDKAKQHEKQSLPRLSTGNSHQIGLRDRIHHFTWAWFTLTMSTGGIALLLAKTPHRFNGLTIIGSIICILDILLFVSLCIGITTRFLLFPSTFKASLTHPTESLFFATFWISIANLISNISLYGTPHVGLWLPTTLRVLFWIYLTLTFLLAIAQYLFLFTGKPFTLHSMTPAWILPIFPIMLTGTLAAVLSPSQSPENAYPILIAGITFQGLGIMVACFMYAPYLSRLMTAGLPHPDKRPGMFVAVGPPSFTALALLGMSEQFERVYPAYSSLSSVTHTEIIADVFRIISVGAAVFLLGTAFWFFCISLVAVVMGFREMGFHLIWWALVFPNVGFTVAVISVGNSLESEPILWVGSVLTILLVVVWAFVGVMHGRAVWKGEVAWPGKDEDHDD